MLPLSGSIRIYLAVEPVDMRKQANGLWAMVEGRLKEDPRSSKLFGFTNRRRDLVKLLYWDGTGVWLFCKRLESGRYSWPAGSDQVKVELTTEALVMLLSGIELKDGCRKAWYER